MIPFLVFTIVVLTQLFMWYHIIDGWITLARVEIKTAGMILALTTLTGVGIWCTYYAVTHVLLKL